MSGSPPAPDAKPVRHLSALVALGATVGVCSSPILAMVVGTCFRFPVPFAGILHGPEHIGEFLVGSLLYLFIGGAVVQAVMGSFAGTIAYLMGQPSGGQPYGLAVGLAVTFACPGVLLLATLDWFIGHW